MLGGMTQVSYISVTTIRLPSRTRPRPSSSDGKTPRRSRKLRRRLYRIAGALKERDQFDALGDYARCCDAIDLMTDLIPGATKKLAPMLTVDETIVSKNVTNALWRLLSTVAYWSP